MMRLQVVKFLDSRRSLSRLESLDLNDGEKGMVLISVLVFSSLISLLVAMGLSASELQLRMSANQLAQAKNFYIAEVGLKASYQKIEQGIATCQIAPISSYHLLIKPASWWKSSMTCHGQLADRNYYYVIEPLQIDNCATFDGKSAVRYYRITVRAAQSHHNSAVTLLQATLAQSVPQRETCQTSQRQLHGIWQSWRQLR